MRRGEFGRQSPGRLVSITVDESGQRVEHIAFVPAPLPAEFTLENKTWMAVFEASRNLTRLNAIAQERLENPKLLVRPTIRREAVSTSAIEGTVSSMLDVMRSDTDVTLPRSAATIEVLNFVRATEHAITRRASLPLSVRFACELHEILMKGTQGQDWQTGRVRRTQVFIGSRRGRSIRHASYVPPPPGDALRDGLSRWEKWIHADSPMHPLVRAAVAHYQFEALHPFTDGNGRIGRLLAVMQIIDYGMLTDPIVNLSPYIEARADEYRKRLRDVSTKGAWDAWIRFFCDAFAEQAFDAEVRIRALLIWRDGMLERLRKKGVKGVAHDVVGDLIAHPSVTVKSIANRHKVSVQAANQAVARLVDLRIIREITGKQYGRMFEAADVYEILTR